jgi:hypothetical protein
MKITLSHTVSICNLQLIVWVPVNVFFFIFLQSPFFLSWNIVITENIRLNIVGLLFYFQHILFTSSVLGVGRFYINKTSNLVYFNDIFIRVNADITIYYKN